MPSPRTTQYNFRLDSLTAALLERLAQRDQRHKTAVVVLALREYAKLYLPKQELTAITKRLDSV